MNLTVSGLKDRAGWESAGFALPSYDVCEIQQNTIEKPRWAHFGIGNIFRVFIGGIADELINMGLIKTGLTCVETYDYEIADRIYRPYDNLTLNVILHGDGTREKRVIGSLGECVKADSSDPREWERLKEIFRSPTLQLVSFTITEKGYSLTDSSGDYRKGVKDDIEYGPQKVSNVICILTSMLLLRYLEGSVPLAIVSMDNCAHNGDLLKEAVLRIAGEWINKGFADAGFIDYLSNSDKIAFPCTMIDKITPRPSSEIASDLAEDGVDGMDPVVTEKSTYIAPFANAEKPQYLVIEDKFPNGRPPLEHGRGVYLTSREIVGKAERMKVTACLNPVHSATGPLGVVLGIDLFADVMKDPDLYPMARAVAYDEGLPVSPDPGIISPQEFTDELFRDRFPNRSLGDTNLRLSTDVSQGVGVRFGETVKAYVNLYGSAERLTAIPLGIAGWLRYMMGIDDEGNTYSLAPDPMNDEIQEILADIKLGDPASLDRQLYPLLSNEKLFHTDLYEAGIGKKIESMFREMIAGTLAVRRTVHKYFG